MKSIERSERVGLSQFHSLERPLQPLVNSGSRISASCYESLSLHGLLFPFTHSNLDDLAEKDLARLEEFAASISADARRVREIMIYGHSDRLGPPERKLQRSQMRARAVAEVFTRRGIDPARITIIALGAAEPLTDYPTHFPYPQGCLAPDRRVTIAVRLAGR